MVGKRTRRQRCSKQRTKRVQSSSESEFSSTSTSSSSDSEYAESDPETTPERARKKSRWDGRLRRTLLSTLLKNAANAVRSESESVEETEPPFVPGNLDELIELAQRQLSERARYVDCERLPTLLPHLLELQALVGLNPLKTRVAQLVLRHLQIGLPRPTLNHAVVYGNPGVGKTTFVNVLAKIMSCLGVTQTSKVVHASQENMVAGFLGQTAEKTQSLVESAFGGVLLIDEASSLSDGRSAQNTDSFSKSAVDTLNRLLTEKADEFVCILAGYEEEIQRDFFSLNPGLERRFPTVYHMAAYTAEELAEITLLKLKQTGLELLDATSIRADLFNSHRSEHFKAMGGDVTTLVAKIVSAHAVRVFGKPLKTSVSAESVQEGFEDYLRTKNSLRTTTVAYADMYL